MGMPPVCSCLCEPADATGASSSSSGSLFALPGCNCLVAPRQWRVTCVFTSTVPACVGIINDIVCDYVDGCRWVSACIQSSGGVCGLYVEVNVVYDSGTGGHIINVYYYGQKAGVVAQRSLYTFTPTVTDNQNCAVSRVATLGTDDNTVTLLCGWNLFNPAPATVTVAPA